MRTTPLFPSPLWNVILSFVWILAPAVPVFSQSADKVAEPVAAAESDVQFCIGVPDGYCSEFALVKTGGYPAFPNRFPRGNAVYTVGKSQPQSDWPFVHPAPMDQSWAKGEPRHPFEIRFTADKTNTSELCFIIGYMATLDEKLSEVAVTVNGNALPPQRPKPVGGADIVYDPSRKGKSGTMLFIIPAGWIRAEEENRISIVLIDRSWILYDYVALREKTEPLAMREKPQLYLLATFQNNGMKHVEKIVFAVRPMGFDGHWYANFGYYADDENRLPYKNGGKLCVYDVNTKETTTLIDDPDGAIRDPQLDYDATKILFSYRKNGTRTYHLYEIPLNGGELHQLTDGPFDDIEPTYLPNGDIIFVSTRGKRWVQCWLTQVATLHRCDGNGGNIREISCNAEQDNTPWVLPSGQILYTRWEYVDRSQVDFHHLWSMSPDGTRQMVFYGNMNPSILMIDAKPVPGSEKIVSLFSPGHGRDEHGGMITLVDPRGGPDDKKSVKNIASNPNFRDPWAFSESEFLAALDSRIILIDDDGNEQTLLQLPENFRKMGMAVHEPRPVLKRQREPFVADLVDATKPTGELTLIDIYEGRNMEGVPRGSIKNLLVLEVLPKPINFTGGMEPMTYGGSFTLERIMGTVPVEPDGSAFFELPALRSFFFVAMDENNTAVKRMQSFTNVMPGESSSCLGCHEHRTKTPPLTIANVTAMRRSPSVIQPIAGYPDVMDYTRDIQPIWDKHCVSCHNNDHRDGGVNLTGDHTPLYSISYFTITAKSLVADGRNRPVSNYPPYTLGTGSSTLLEYVSKKHYDVSLSERELQLVKLWIETGATYLGTYAGLGCGMIGGYAQNNLDRRDMQWPEMKESVSVLQQNCISCHTGSRQIPLSPSDEIGGQPWIQLSANDVRRRYSRQLVFNLTHPEKSLLLMAPLAKSAGGFESCGKPIFTGKDDSDYQTVLRAVERTKQELDTIKRFDMPDFVPRPQYVREMIRYGVLPANTTLSSPVDVYELDQLYWRSLWHR